MVRCLLLAALVAGCAEGRNHHSSSEEEDSSIQYTTSQPLDEVRRGVRLQLRYDSIAVAFTGTVTNISEIALRQVRVEVHLSDGTELGPTASVDLAPSEHAPVRLSAARNVFETWTGHAEVGRGEHAEGEHR